MAGFWYAIQTVSGLEAKGRDLLLKVESGLVAFLPQRDLKIRKSGLIKSVRRALFPGYFFIHFDQPLTIEESQKMLRRVSGFGAQTTIIKVVGVDEEKQKVHTVKEDEIEPILELAGKTQVIRFSKFIKTGKRVSVIDGPLKGREVIIKKVNARKNRITIELVLMGQPNTIDIGGELVELPDE